MEASTSGFVRAFLVLGVLLGVVGDSRAQTCAPCTTEDSSVSDQLERAFHLVLSLPDCAGTEHLKGCRDAEGLIDGAYAGLDSLFEASVQKTEGCLSCDPRPQLLPLARGLAALAELLEEKDFEEFTPSRQRVERALARWQALTCCGEGAPAALDRNREEDARRILIEKCGSQFVDKRQGLRQVFRSENDHKGCYQSRACRSATSYNGIGVSGGFWTYDGEYWYIWAKRQTPKGDWASCEP